MASVLTVANAILGSAQRLERTLTPLQLMKLAYMSEGWMLGLHNRSMFTERIEAWKYGPSIPVLYHRIKEFGSSVIEEQIPAPIGDVLDGTSISVLNGVVKSYGALSGTELSTLTHRPGSPWSKVWREGSSHLEIPRETIREHYLKLKDSPTVTAA